MTAKTFLAAAALSMTLATPALASSTSVMKGIQNGSLTSDEVYELVTMRAELDATDRRIRSDGRVSRGERSYLDELTVTLNRQLKRLVNNHDRRWNQRPHGW